MEGEHIINHEKDRESDAMDQDSCSTTPQECLSPDHDTPTPTPSAADKKEKVCRAQFGIDYTHPTTLQIESSQHVKTDLDDSESNDIQLLKLQLKEVKHSN